MKTIRIASGFLLLLVLTSMAQAAPPAIPQGWSKYIIVLNDASFRPARGQAAVAVPDIPQLGGMVIHQWGRRISVALPPGLARTLRNHPGVRELQRVYTGTPLPEEPPPSVLRLHGDALHAQTDSAPPTWFSGEYLYDGSGNIKNIGWGTDPAKLNGDGKANAYLYDTAGRLVSGTANYAVNGTETYTYDSFGNVMSVTHNGQTSTFAVDSGSNRLQGVLYDVAGNLVNDGSQWYGYDPLNMLRQASGFRSGEAYIYTADDERIGIDRGLEIDWSIRDFDGNVLREFSGGSIYDWSYVRDYVYRDGQLLASHGEQADGSTLIHYHLDHLGTPRLVTTQNKRRLTQDDYFPFGTEQTSISQAMTVFGFESELSHRFTGHERDFYGDPSFEDVPYIDYMHARYYNPKMGRFLSVDPILGEAEEPQSWNGYAYVQNRPLSSDDPDGMMPRPAFETDGAVSGSITITAEDPRRKYERDLRESNAIQRLLARQRAIALAALFLKVDGPALSKYGYGRLLQLRFGTNVNKPYMIRVDFKAMSQGEDPKLHINFQQQGKGAKGINKHIDIDWVRKGLNLLKGGAEGVIKILPEAGRVPLLNPCMMNPALCAGPMDNRT